jgi:hypothetical protein
MRNNKASNRIEETPHEMPLPTIEWGFWPLWVLASVTAGLPSIVNIGYSKWLVGIVRTNLVFIFVGILIGFMPWLAQKWQISKFGWWICNFTALGITVWALVFIERPRYIFLGYIILWVLPLVIASSIVALITRRVCQRWLNSDTNWWKLAVAGIEVILVFIVILFFCMIFWNAM